MINYFTVWWSNRWTENSFVFLFFFSPLISLFFSFMSLITVSLIFNPIENFPNDMLVNHRSYCSLTRRKSLQSIYIIWLKDIVKTPRLEADQVYAIYLSMISILTWMMMMIDLAFHLHRRFNQSEKSFSDSSVPSLIANSYWPLIHPRGVCSLTIGWYVIASLYYCFVVILSFFLIMSKLCFACAIFLSLPCSKFHCSSRKARMDIYSHKLD